LIEIFSHRFPHLPRRLFAAKINSERHPAAAGKILQEDPESLFFLRRTKLAARFVVKLDEQIDRPSTSATAFIAWCTTNV
jgi:hypothetical protein